MSLKFGGKSKKLAEFKLQELPLLECMPEEGRKTIFGYQGFYDQHDFGDKYGGGIAGWASYSLVGTGVSRVPKK